MVAETYGPRPDQPFPRSTSEALGRGQVTAVRRALAILEVIGEQPGGASARAIADRAGIPVPTVYRLLQTLVTDDYIVHLKAKSKYALGYKFHRLTTSLHRQVGVPPPIQARIRQLHRAASAAAYFAVYRGSEVVVAYVADSPLHPRVEPLDFGFHEATHATAFGKIMLTGMDVDQRDDYLLCHGMPKLAPSTIQSRDELEAALDTISRTGIAWEYEEFMAGLTCAAAAVRDASGAIVGSVAISAAIAEITAQERPAIDSLVRQTGADVSRLLRAAARSASRTTQR